MWFQTLPNYPIENWRLIDLGIAEPYRAQTFYEAVAIAVDQGLSPNTLLLCQPATPYVCIGFHQELEKEVDVDYCHNNNLPIIRRAQGGGATYLDSNQIFYQIVAHKESKAIPLDVEHLFAKLLNITVHVYRNLGLPAEFKPLNDVITRGKKISGNGAGQFGANTTLLVGNIILDLNYDTMARVLKVPSEKFRDKMAQSMKEWVTSLKRELGYTPSPNRIKQTLVEGYEHSLRIKLTPTSPTADEEEKWRQEVKPKHLSQNWLQMGNRRKIITEGKAVRIKSGIKIAEIDHKAKKLIRTRAELMGNRILDIIFSGDFFMIPENALQTLESNLKGATLNREELMKRITQFYEKSQSKTPGIVPEDFVEAIMKLEKFTDPHAMPT